MYSSAFEAAIMHAMLYEVSSNFKLTPEVEQGLVETREQRRAVGYVDDPLDRGGETKFGIAKNANPDVHIYTLTWDHAKDIYYHRYWLAGKCNQLPGRVAVLHFDGCVNHGPGRANKFLQAAVGATPDGYIGPQTLRAANGMDPIDICENICKQREQFYLGIVERKPNQSRFLKGWLRRITEMRDFTCDPNRDFIN